LQYSGLPEWLNQNVNRNAWTLFKTIVEIDCARNSRPESIEITPAQLAQFCGIDPKAAMTTLEGLRKKKCVALFLPDHPEDTALVEVKTPLPTPRGVEELRLEFPFNTLEGAVRFRYAYAGTEESESSDEAQNRAAGGKRDFQRIVDLYLNSVGFKINTFILDELRLLCQRFDMTEVEKTFARARKNDIRSLGWVAKELYRNNRLKETRAAKET
jgi:hypothetical protein